jgi:uncharacterized protein (DUF58 family)
VRLRRCTRGICLLALLLIAGACILDDLVVFFSGVALITGLLVCYFRYTRLFSDTVRSVEVTRSADRSRILKGATIRVSTSITLVVPPDIQVDIRELLPAPLALHDGTTSLQVQRTPGPASPTLSYRVMPVVHGEFLFPGISLVIRNSFFENTIDLTAGKYSGPRLTVQPFGSMRASELFGSFDFLSQSAGGRRELERMTLLSGVGIRSLREYYAGDDIRNIDWKLTAKFGKLYIREYMGTVNLPLLIIIDLPWSGSPGSARDFARMVDSVAGLTEHSIKTYQAVSLLLISGMNILEFIEEKKDLQYCLSLLREWMHPVERAVHQYRTHDRADIRLRVRALETRIQEGRDNRLLPFYSGLQKRYLTVLPYQKPTVFAGQLNRIFSGLAVNEIFLFTLGTGEDSHLRQIIRLCTTMKFRVHIRTPAAGAESSGPTGRSWPGVETLEVF